MSEPSDYKRLDSATLEERLRRKLAACHDALAARDAELSRLQEENERLNRALNTPELDDFAAAVVLEGQHQRERWGAEHDVGKAPEDWFWLLGYLGGKALHAAKAGDLDKAKHHTISTAAALGNWHAQLSGISTDMRPGVDPVARGYEAASQEQGGSDRG